MNRPMILLPLLASLVLSGCVTPPPKPDDPYYAPVLPRTPLPAAQNSGAIYQPGFETNLYDDRKAYRVGDIITITLSERTQASKKAGSSMSKDSSANLGLTSLFGGGVSIDNPSTSLNPLKAEDLSLDVGYSGTRDTDGESDANQSNSLTGSITVTVAEVPLALVHDQPLNVPAEANTPVPAVVPLGMVGVELKLL